MDCPTCPRNGNCELQALAAQLNVRTVRLSGATRADFPPGTILRPQSSATRASTSFASGVSRFARISKRSPRSNSRDRDSTLLSDRPATAS
ncbi:hypothetical protein [Thermodesulfitimonas sp.]